MGVGGGGSLPPVLTSLDSVPTASFAPNIPILSHEPLCQELLPLPTETCPCVCLASLGHGVWGAQRARAQVLVPLLPSSLGSPILAGVGGTNSFLGWPGAFSV